MNDKFAVDFNALAQTLLPAKSYRLSDVEDRIEKVAYDLVRFRDNQDTDQLWRIEESSDGPVIVALYGDDGGLMKAESGNDWETISDKKAVHVFYKGEPLASLSSSELGIPASELSIVQRWLPKKLAEDENLQKSFFSKVPEQSRRVIAKRFPELTKVAQVIDSIEEKENKLDPEALTAIISMLEEE